MGELEMPQSLTEAITALEKSLPEGHFTNIMWLNEHPGSFAWALPRLNRGQRMQRAGWNGKGMYIELQVPDEWSKMTLPYIFMYTAQGDLVPWLASQSDILADDWSVFA
jgi:hypothetical protein